MTRVGRMWQALIVEGIPHMFRFCSFLRCFQSPPLREDDRGATAVEYSLMIGLIAAVIVGAVTAFGLGVLGLFNALPPGL